MTTPLLAELRRCPTCNRWGGQRMLGEDGRTVELDPTNSRGACQEGPWHGSLRGPRNACGQWLCWIRIPDAGEPVSTAARTQSSSSSSTL